MVMTISPARTASPVLLATLPPAVARRSQAAALRSKPVTSCPALTRLAAIGPPMFPRPMNPIAVIALSSLVEIEFARAERPEVEGDVVVPDLGQRRRLPARVLVLVDEEGAHALEEIVALHRVLRHPVLELQRLLDVVGGADLQLPQRHPEAGRRGLGEAGERAPRPLCLRAAARLRLERVDD